MHTYPTTQRDMHTSLLEPYGRQRLRLSTTASVAGPMGAQQCGTTQRMPPGPTEAPGPLLGGAGPQSEYGREQAQTGVVGEARRPADVWLPSWWDGGVWGG